MAGILAGLDAEVIAIAFLFAVLVAVLIIRPLLVALLGNAPVIGGWLAGSVDSGLAAFERSIAPAAAAALGVFSDTLAWIQAQASQLTNTIVGFAQLTETAFLRITTAVVPNLIANAIAQAGALSSAAITQLQAAESAAVANLKTDLAALEARAQALAAATLIQAQGLIGQLIAALNVAFAKVEQDALNLVLAERLNTIRAIQASETYSAQLYAQSVDFTRAVAGALVADLGGVVVTERTELQSGVSSLEKLIAADKAALSAALTGAIAGVAVDIAAIRALKCIQQCAPLGDLGEGIALLDATALIVLLGAIAHDPAATAQAVNGLVRPLASGTTDTARTLLGV